MEFEKGIAKIATIKTKAGSKLLLGKTYSPGVVYRVTKKVALVAIESRGFDVVWDKGFEPKADTISTEPVDEPEPTPEPEHVQPEPTVNLESELKKYDDLKVDDAEEWVKTQSDKELLTYLSENARWKGSKEAAADRLADLAE